MLGVVKAVARPREKFQPLHSTRSPFFGTGFSLSVLSANFDARSTKNKEMTAVGTTEQCLSSGLPYMINFLSSKAESQVFGGGELMNGCGIDNQRVL